MNGIWPVVTSSPWPTMRATCARTSSTVMSSDSSTRAARPFFLAEEAEQDVLGADVVVLERAGLVLCEDDYLPRSLGEAFEQIASFPPRSAELLSRPS